MSFTDVKHTQGCKTLCKVFSELRSASYIILLHCCLWCCIGVGVGVGVGVGTGIGTGIGIDIGIGVGVGRPGSEEFVHLLT